MGVFVGTAVGASVEVAVGNAGPVDVAVGLGTWIEVATGGCVGCAAMVA